MKKLIILTALVIVQHSYGQVDSTLAGSSPGPVSNDSIINTNQDGIYTNRPFTQGDKRTAVGGYLEANTNYFVEDGVGDGFSMEMRRFNVFLYSQIGKRIRMLSELEFEHGTEEIALETAIMDFTIDPAFNFRGGILLPPIGAFNQNHDSPLWEIVDRPLVSTQIIPSTLSEVGFGVFGKLYKSNMVFTYDLYLVNGLQDGVVLNEDGRTSMSAGKTEEMFAEDNNGAPMLTGKLGIRHRKYGELGLSYYGGAYNTHMLDGAEIDTKRRLSIMAVDLNAQFGKLNIKGEAAYNTIQVADDLSELFGEKQWGAHLDFIYPIMNRRVLKYDNTVLNGIIRLEKIDYNIGTFASTNTNIGDEVEALVLGLSLRPLPTTVIKANYRYHWITDALNNAKVKAAGVQVGLATYF